MIKKERDEKGQWIARSSMIRNHGKASKKVGFLMAHVEVITVTISRLDRIQIGVFL